MKRISMKKTNRTNQYSNAANTNAGYGAYRADLKAGKKKKKNQETSAGMSSSNKFWIAALAGASAGVIAGILMAPDRGRETMESWKRNALRLGDQLDQQFRTAMNKLESKGLTRPGDSLQIQGRWDTVKGKMKTQYGDLTDQDLAYIEGQEDQFLGNLQTRLGKTKQELVSWINSLV